MSTSSQQEKKIPSPKKLRPRYHDIYTGTKGGLENGLKNIRTGGNKPEGGEKKRRKTRQKKWCWARNDHTTSKSCNIHEAPNVPESMDN